MAEIIEIDINAKDNTGTATKSVLSNFQNLGKQISGVGNSMTNIFTRPIMDLERLILKNKDVQAALDPVTKAFTELGNQLSTSFIPVIKDLTPALVDLADSLGKIITWFSSLPIGVQEAIVGFIALLAVIGPVLVFVGQLVVGLTALGTLWTTLSGIITPIAATVLPAIGAALAAITLPVWLLIAGIGLLVATIIIFGEQAWQTVVDIRKIFIALWELLLIKIDEIKKAFLNVDWEGIGKNMMQGIRDGINAGLSWIVNAARNAAQAAVDAARRLLGINSPSLAFQGIGINMMRGMANGINSTSSLPIKATSKAVSGTIPAATSSPTRAGGGITLVYSPQVSLASQSEAETVLLPMLRKLQRQVG